MPSLAVLDPADSLPTQEVDVGGIIEGSRLAAAEALASLRERLAGRGSPVPMLAQFNPAIGPPGVRGDPADSREEEVGSIEDPLAEDLADSREEEVESIEDPLAEDLALLLETSSLDLSRLSAVRPQIVLPGTSAWILIRNPAEVDRFMNRLTSGQDSETEGLVDVAVWIDEYGSVKWAEISKSSGHEDMDEIALALFNEVASFRPARDQGVRVSMSAIFSVPFPW